MSLPALPDDALARVCSHLHPSERAHLRAVCGSLFRSLRYTNGELWQDVYRYKYNLHSTTDRAVRTLQIREAADAYLCYTGAWTNIVGHPHHANFASYHAPTDALYAAASNCLFQWPLNGKERDSIFARLPGRASAITSCASSVAVAWDRSVTVHATRSLQTTRPLRGHQSTIRSVAFLFNDTVLASGADDGTIRLHHVATRRSQGVLRGHGGPVRTMREGGPAGGAGAGLFSIAPDRTKQWDIEMRRCTRTYPGRHCAIDADGGTVYVATPGESGAVKVFDPRAAGVVAVLSLPRKWGSKRIEALAEENGALAAAVGSGGVAYWRARGTWEAEPVGYPGWWGHDQPNLLKTVLLRDGVAYAAGGAREMIALGVEGHKPQTCAHPCEHVGGAYLQLIHAGGKRIIAVREDDVVLFDQKKKGAVMIEDSARRAAGPPRRGTRSSDSSRGKEKRPAVKGSLPRPFKYGRFWDKSRMCSSEEDEEEEEDDEEDRMQIDAYSMSAL